MGGSSANGAVEPPHCTFDTAPGSPARTGLCCQPAPFCAWDRHRPNTPLPRCEEHKNLVRYGVPSSPPRNLAKGAKR